MGYFFLGLAAPEPDLPDVAAKCDLVSHYDL